MFDHPLSASFTPLVLANDAVTAAFLSVSRAYFNTFENLAELNFSTARQVMDDKATGYKHLLGAASVQQMVEIQTGLAQTFLERNATYARAAYGLTTAAVGELAPLVQGQYAEWQAVAKQAAAAISGSIAKGKK